MAASYFRKYAAGAVLGAALAIGTVSPSLAADTSVFQSIIKNQMSAFAADDAKTAFSFATRSLQQRFQTPEFFMQMVKSGYQPVLPAERRDIRAVQNDQVRPDPRSLRYRSQRPELARPLQFGRARRWVVADLWMLSDKVGRVRSLEDMGKFKGHHSAAMSPRAQSSLVLA